MSRKASQFQKMVASLGYRAKEVFKPLSCGKATALHSHLPELMARRHALCPGANPSTWSERSRSESLRFVS